MRARTSRRVWTGLTLVELLVTMACLALLLGVTVPGARRLIAANQTQLQVDRLMRAINLTRSEAIRRNRPVSLCPSAVAADGIAACTGAYSGGWMVFSNDDRDRTLDPDRDELLRAFHAVPAGYQVTNRLGTRAADELITYRADGSASRNATFQVCPPAGTEVAPYSVVLNIVGRPRRAQGWGACP
jgi:type IV fimbrial biogenesis protein FimT